MGYSIAIDGPAGAGKSTIAKLIAKERGCIYVDTGAMYRAMAVYFLRQSISPEDEEAITGACDDIEVVIKYEDNVQQVYLNGENVTSILRTEEVGRMASASSVYPAVRAKLLDLQRKLAREYDVVMDGRDIGTHVLPDADVKIYMTASVEERAERRYRELMEKGDTSADYEKIKADIAERDYRDMNREIAPLKQAKDANYLDTSDMSIDEVVKAIVAFCK